MKSYFYIRFLTTVCHESWAISLAHSAVRRQVS